MENLCLPEQEDSCSSEEVRLRLKNITTVKPPIDTVSCLPVKNHGLYLTLTSPGTRKWKAAKNDEYQFLIEEGWPTFLRSSLLESEHIGFDWPAYFKPNLRSGGIPLFHRIDLPSSKISKLSNEIS